MFPRQPGLSFVAFPSRFEIVTPQRFEIVISPAGSRSVFPQQPGLKFVVSPSRVESVISPASLKVAVSPAEVCVGSFSLAKSLSGSSSVEFVPSEDYSFPSSSAISQQGGDWSDIEFLSRVARVVPEGGYFLCIHHLEKHSILHP